VAELLILADGMGQRLSDVECGLGGDELGGGEFLKLPKRQQVGDRLFADEGNEELRHILHLFFL